MSIVTEINIREGALANIPSILFRRGGLLRLFKLNFRKSIQMSEKNRPNYNVTLKSEISNFRSVTSNHPKLFLVLSRMMKIGLMHGNQCKPRPNFLENNCYN